MKERRIVIHGKTFMEMFIALVILGVLVAGVYFMIQYVSGQYGYDNSAAELSASERTAAIAQKMSKLINSADVDVIYDSSDGDLLCVSVRGYTLVSRNQDSLYILENAFDDPDNMTDDEKVETAKAAIGKDLGSLYTDSISTFYLDTSTMKDGRVTISIVTNFDGEMSKIDKEILLNVYVTRRANGTAFIREVISTPTPTATNTPTPTATNTPTPTATNTPKPTATNTPAPTNTPTTAPTIAPVIATTQSTASGSDSGNEGTALALTDGLVSYSVLKNADANAVVEISILCTETKASANWCVGGVCFGSYEVTDNTKFQYVINYDPTLGKIYKVSYTVSDLLAEAKKMGTEEIRFNFYNGFEIDSAALISQ